MESLGKKIFARRRSDSILLGQIATIDGIETILRKVSSEVLFKNVPIKITFLNDGNENFGDNTNDFDCFSNMSSSNDEYPKEFDDFEKNMEQYVIVSKYGLPSKITCTCHVERSIPSSRSCTDLSRIASPSIIISRPKSCFEFTKNTEDLDNICMRHVNNLRQLRQYNEACQVYELFLKSFEDSEDFDNVEYSFQLQYPHLWDHLVEYYSLYPDSELISKENESKLKIIHSCKCMLKEEEIYRVNNIDLFKSKLSLSGKKKDLHEDFITSCNYLKKEYPFLFTVLTWKHKLSKFVTKRMVIEKNRLKVIQMANLPHEVLIQHNEICGAQHEDLQEEDFYDEEYLEDEEEVEN